MHHSGFSLLEIVITLALIAMIALFSTVSYQSHLLKMQQSVVKFDLLMTAEAIERCYDCNQTYEGISLTKLDYTAKTEAYIISITRNKTNSYQLAAIPKKLLPEDQCGTFYLDQDGNKTISGHGSLEDCW